MGFLIAAIGSIFSGLIAWFTTMLGRKLVVITFTMATFLFLTAAFLFTIKALITSVLLAASMPAWLTYGIGLFLPFNFAFVLSSVLAAHAARWAYDKAIEKITLINGAT